MKKLPIVMPSNNPETAFILNQEFPNRLGVLFTPGTTLEPMDLQYVLDNGRFSARKEGTKWSEKKFMEMLDEAKKLHYDPIWLVVPDVVGDSRKTLEEWNIWYDKLIQYGWKLAIAVQNGMTVDDILQLQNKPDVIFVGGSTDWKWKMAEV